MCYYFNNSISKILFIITNIYAFSYFYQYRRYNLFKIIQAVIA